MPVCDVLVCGHFLYVPDCFDTCRICDNTQVGVLMATKLDKLLEKEAQLKAQIQQAKAAERTLEKKRDTRRKILVGAAVLARVEQGEWPKQDLLMMMDGFLSRPNERELFGLDSPDEAVSEGKAAKADGKGDAQASEKTAAKAGRKKVLGRSRKTLPEKPIDIDNEFNL